MTLLGNLTICFVWKMYVFKDKKIEKKKLDILQSMYLVAAGVGVSWSERKFLDTA